MFPSPAPTLSTLSVFGLGTSSDEKTYQDRWLCACSGLFAAEMTKGGHILNTHFELETEKAQKKYLIKLLQLACCHISPVGACLVWQKTHYCYKTFPDTVCSVKGKKLLKEGA